MGKLAKSSFFWRFAGGFMLGALGVVTLHPAQASDAGFPAVEAVR